MISAYEQRERCKQYVRAALDASNMSRADFAAACGMKSVASVRNYICGSVCPYAERIASIYAATGVKPEDYGLNVMRGMECAEEMRELFKAGHTMSELAKATRMNRATISRLIDNDSASIATILTLEEAWRAYNVPERINDPEFAASVATKTPQTRTERELHWIERVWGVLAETAKSIRDGFWTWQSATLYNFELELITDDLYEFRAIRASSGDISTRREVHIA